MRIRIGIRILAVLGVVLAVCVTPAILFAHAHLVRSTPAANARLTMPPTALSLWFSERPELKFTTLQLLDSAGTAIPLGAVATLAGDGTGFTAPISQSLADGRYTVVWRTAAADGHATNGRFSFVVAMIGAEMPAPAVIQQTPNALITSSSRNGFSTATRWAELVAVLTLVGTMIFRLFVLQRAKLPAAAAADAADRARRLAHSVLVLFVITTLWRLSAESDLIPTASTARAAAMRTVIGSTSWGHGWLVGLVGVVVVTLGLAAARGGATGWIVAAFGVVAICFSEGLTGHPGAMIKHRSLATAIDLAHLLGAGGWIGGLATLVLSGLPATRRVDGGERARAGHQLVRAYHRAAVECVALVAVTGVVAEWLRFAAVSEFWLTPYGRVLLVKVSLVAVVLGFGFYHWRTIVIPDWDDDTSFRFKRSATAELLVGAMVVGAAAVLVSTALPH